MAKSGDVLQIPDLGVRIVFDRVGAEDGELRVEVLGRARGILTQEHVHLGRVERHEVLSGAMRLVLDGRDHLLREGEAMEVPAGTPHRQVPAGAGEGRVRIVMRPAGRTAEFLERLAAYSRDGRINRLGFPSPLAAAELVRDFGDEGRAAQPPAGVQRALAAAILGGARLARGARARLRDASAEYVFVDEWDVAAPAPAVFAALADARTYPQWWRPVYLDVQAEGPPAVGHESRQHFKGRLPYHLRTRSRVVRLDPPHLVEGEVDGDLRGRGTWTLTPTPTGTHVRFDWQVHADRPLLRALTPALRPLLRWNHDWAIARAIEGLEPYAQRHAPAASPSTETSEEATAAR
jgi:uncharacterized protein YndB with AHSA1/START domain/mannose-6-phosphate isomerase-like protein (cupin superfamily)